MCYLSESLLLWVTLYLTLTSAMIAKGGCVQEEFVETVQHCCCRNATPVLGMGKPTSTILVRGPQSSVGVGSPNPLFVPLYQVSTIDGWVSRYELGIESEESGTTTN